MKCGCNQCGSLMDHKEQGIFSKCICPACKNECDVCLGTNTVLSVKEIVKQKEAAQEQPPFYNSNL